MPTEFLQLRHRKLIYLITSGETTLATSPATEDFSRLLDLAKAAVEAKVDLFQIREKELSARVLYELTRSVATLTRGNHTKLLVNDRADIAAAAGADGVHLATTSLPTGVIRKSFGKDFLIGVSTHSEAESLEARATGADFVVFGPVFETPAKLEYGRPQGLDKLRIIASATEDFPVLAVGGIDVDRVAECVDAGASGVAAIRMLSDPTELHHVVAEIRSHPRNHTKQREWI
ncbi:MAG TPA: thiamine phosphate synthase [Pyrinomonadaceae bacterium]|nr:thiamine phosphate synthase [Pyrinomonadaceae bacterium]